MNYAAFLNSDHHEVLYYACMLIPVFPPVGWIMFPGLVCKTHPPKFNNYPNGATGKARGTAQIPSQKERVGKENRRREIPGC